MKLLQKALFGAVVAFVDVLAVTALPHTVKSLHEKTTTHAHLYITIGVYGVLALATLGVVVSVVRAVLKRAAPKPAPAAPRAGYYSSRGGL